ncbi:MAG: hypothetical protein COV46_07445 [Deltaproteobacteria bacterium CG11_big_fil_rev_8_21_14_0_20_49_13]|nr:MAG: hypothetical protein COV46_07445 [Deltaproteobacteria bacterium CG11_big_fil_rev_8_21_14_0_20_49_13]
MPVDKVPNIGIGISPNFLARVIATAGYIGDSSEVRAKLRKLLGDPKPEELDLDSIPPEIAALFAEKGTLQKIRKKLESITKKQAKRLAATKGRTACVDEDDIVYVGVDFLEKYKDREDLLAGIMAHEWGHMVSPLPSEEELTGNSYDELMAIRREDEANADGFAGRMLYLMGYSVEDMVEFLKNLEKIEKKIVSKKYHPVDIREAILNEAFAAQKRSQDSARKLLIHAGLGFSHVLKSKLIGEG